MNIQNKIYLSIVIFILLVILIIVFIIYPLFGEIKKNSKELISQKEKLVSLEIKIDNLEKFKNLYQKYKPNLEKIDNLFIDSEVPVGFIGFMEKTAKESQMEIKISPTSSRKTEKDPWSFIVFQINSNSSPFNFLKFLEKLETSPYLINIQNLNITKLSKSEVLSVEEIKTAFSIKVYTK